MNPKVFSLRFNRELSSNSFPEELTDKTKAVSVVFGVSRHIANSLIFGHKLPDEELLHKICEILDVCPQWLTGVTERRKIYTGREVVESE